ncbi:hypothetical protein UFOVP594_10 [uncultured Caudovirales phage]|uniref:Uncharacterized protein n=1 Tax=uncultured Caudovirales phage TaxID=2100421 RepID=A0A6J5MWM7_9CAUD|nr:hypothetical protein UFOVP594_10 [uncultured Caudovirales phage]
MPSKKNPQDQKSKITANDLGKIGGNATLAKHGTDHYSRIARIRWQKKKAVPKT